MPSYSIVVGCGDEISRPTASIQQRLHAHSAAEAGSRRLSDTVSTGPPSLQRCSSAQARLLINTAQLSAAASHACTHTHTRYSSPASATAVACTQDGSNRLHRTARQSVVVVTVHCTGAGPRTVGSRARQRDGWALPVPDHPRTHAGFDRVNAGNRSYSVARPRM